jgi:hypothetical protein
MQLVGTWKTATVDSGGTLSDEVDLGATFQSVQVMIPAIDSATVSIQSSPSSGGTFATNKVLGHETTGTVALATTAATGSITVIFDNVYAQFIKVLCGAAQNGGARSFTVRGI